LTFIIFIYVIRSYSVQTYVANKFTYYLKDELESNISINKVKIKGFENFEIKDLLIPDQFGDTIAYIPNIHLNINNLELFKKIYVVNDIVIKNAIFNLIKSNENEPYNYEFLLDKLTKSNHKKEKKIKININSLRFDKCMLKHQIFEKKYKDQIFDYKYFKILDINFLFKNIKYSKNKFSFIAERISFKDNKGFEVKSGNCILNLDSSKMVLDDFNISTPYSNLILNKVLYSKGENNLPESSKIVNVNDFRSSLNLIDVNHFIKLPFLYDSSINISSQFHFSDKEILAQNCNVKIGEQSFLRGSFNFKSFLDSNTSFFNFKLNDGEIFKRDIAKFKIKNDNDIFIPIEIPSSLSSLSSLNLNLEAKGNSEKVKTNFSLNSSLGDVFGELNVTNYQSKNPRYLLSVNANHIDGKLIELDSNINQFNAKLNIEGSGFDKSNYDVNVGGRITNLEVSGYTFDDLKINGKLKNQSFNGQVMLSDQYLDFYFNGIFDLNSPYKFDFTFDLNRALLSELGIFNKDQGVNFTFRALASIRGNNIDDFNGNIDLKDIKYFYEGNEYYLDTLSFYSTSSSEEHHLNLQSTFLSFDLNGKYRFKNLKDDFNSFLSFFVPNIIEPITNKDVNYENIRLLVNIHDMSVISKLINPALRISDGSIIELNFSPSQQIANFSIQSNFFSLKNLSFNNMSISAKNDLTFRDSTFNMKIDIGKASVYGLSSENLQLSTNIKNNLTRLNLNWNSSDSLQNGNFELLANFHNQDTVDFNLSKMNLKSKSLGHWKFNDSSKFYMYGNQFYFPEIIFENKNQRVSIDGNLGKNSDDNLNISFEKFDLKNITTLIKANTNNFNVDGTVNADFELSSVNSKIDFTSKLKVNELAVNDHPIGDLTMNSKWKNSSKRLILSGGLSSKENIENISIQNSFLDLEDNQNKITGNLLFNNFKIDFLSPFLPSTVLTDLKGSLDGAVSIEGVIDDPDLNGSLILSDGSISLTDLGAKFLIDGPINIEPNNIEIINADIYDKFNTLGKFSGFYNHNNFSKYSFNFITQFNEPFQVMNNDYENNPNYYGDAFITGFSNISYDTLNGISVNINAKTEKDTKLTVPLYGTEDIVLHDFITFKNPDSNLIQTIDKTPLNDDDFNLNIDLDVTESAEIQLVFDPTVGDMMKTTGTGNIRLTLDKNYDLSIFGSYLVSQGDYTFTLKDFINKKFVIVPGGEITWYGNPYNANLDALAYYNLKTSLKNIMPPIDQNDWSHKSEVNVMIHLQNDLMNPDINFNIDLPKANESAKTALRSIVSNEEQMNKQVFSLMILNKFTPPNQQYYSENTNKINGASTTEALGNQLGNMISSFTDDFDIGFNYSAGDLITNNELSLAMSTQQFNDRLRINTNLGMSQANELSRNPSSFIGDVDVEYKISPNGNFRIHVFNESNEYDLSNQNQANYTQGIGAFYKQTFDSASEFFCEISNLFRSKKKKIDDCSSKRNRD